MSFDLYRYLYDCIDGDISVSLSVYQKEINSVYAHGHRRFAAGHQRVEL
jgi:hypothetical protein